MNNPTQLSKAITRRAAAIAILASFAFSNAFAVAAFADTATINVVSQTTAKYTTDLTQLGRQGRLQRTRALRAKLLALSRCSRKVVFASPSSSMKIRPFRTVSSSKPLFASPRAACPHSSKIARS